MAVFTGLGSDTAPSYTFSSDTNTGIYSPGADQLAISTNGTQALYINSGGNILVADGNRMEIDEVRARDSEGLKLYDDAGAGIFVQDGGNVGVGTNLPQELLNVAQNILVGVDGTPTSSEKIIRSSNTSTFFGNDPGANLVLQSGYGTGAYGSSIQFRTPQPSNVLSTFGTQTTRMTIDTQGRVGMGTTNPGGTLDVKAAAATEPLIVQGPSGEFARIDGSGRLLVGTPSSLGIGKAQVDGPIESFGSNNTVSLAAGATGTVITPVRGYSFINVSIATTTGRGYCALVFADTTTLTIVNTLDDRSSADYSISASGRNLQVTNNTAGTASFYASCISMAFGTGN